MKKILILVSVLICTALLVGCSSTAANPTAAVVPATLAADTSTPNVIVVTATPEVNQVATVEATATLAPTLAPTQTAVPATITITSVTDEGQGRILVKWDTVGDFPAGFQVVWSSTNQTPAFPTDNSTFISDPNARTAEFSGTLNTLYFVRVCRYANNACDVYSNQGYVALFAPTALPTRIVSASTASSKPTSAVTSTPAVASTSTLTSTPVSPKIRIYRMRAAGYGTADIFWTAKGEFKDGFLILYAKNTNSLVYGEARSIRVTDGSYRVATVTGDYFQTYYFKICRYTGTNCDSASNIYAFTFTGPN